MSENVILNPNIIEQVTEEGLDFALDVTINLGQSQCREQEFLGKVSQVNPNKDSKADSISRVPPVLHTEPACVEISDQLQDHSPVDLSQESTHLHSSPCLSMEKESLGEDNISNIPGNMCHVQHSKSLVKEECQSSSFICSPITPSHADAAIKNVDGRPITLSINKKNIEDVEESAVDDQVNTSDEVDFCVMPGKRWRKKINFYKEAEDFEGYEESKLRKADNKHLKKKENVVADKEISSNSSKCVSVCDAVKSSFCESICLGKDNNRSSAKEMLSGHYSKMIDLDEIKRELDENYVDILAEDNEHSVDVRKNADFNGTGIIYKNKDKNLDAILPTIDHLTLKYNIKALEIHLTDIYQSPTLKADIFERVGSDEDHEVDYDEEDALEEEEVPLKVLKDKKAKRIASAKLFNKDSKKYVQEKKLEKADAFSNLHKKKVPTLSLQNKLERCEKPYRKDTQNKKEKPVFTFDRGKFSERTEKRYSANSNLKTILSTSPEKVTESYEESVARKLAERNKRLGISSFTLLTISTPVNCSPVAVNEKGKDKKEIKKKNVCGISKVSKERDFSLASKLSKDAISQSQTENRFTVMGGKEVNTEEHELPQSVDNNNFQETFSSKTSDSSSIRQPSQIPTISIDDDDSIHVIEPESTAIDSQGGIFTVPTHPAKRLTIPRESDSSENTQISTLGKEDPAKLLKNLMKKYDNHLKKSSNKSRKSPKEVPAYITGKVTLPLTMNSIAVSKAFNSNLKTNTNDSPSTTTVYARPIAVNTGPCQSKQPVLKVRLPVKKPSGSKIEDSIKNANNPIVLEISPRKDLAKESEVAYGNNSSSTKVTGEMKSQANHPDFISFHQSQDQHSENEVMRPTNVKCMHPSKRMSLLSQMSPRKEKTKVSFSSSSQERSSPEKTTPHHPSLRLSSVINKPDNPVALNTINNSACREMVGKQVQRYRRSLSLSEGAAYYKPRPLSRQIQPSARLLLSPQYVQAQSYKPWNLGLLRSTPKDADDSSVIGISDSDSDSSSSTDLEMTEIPRVFHISSDEESECEGVKEAEELSNFSSTLSAASSTVCSIKTTISGSDISSTVADYASSITGNKNHSYQSYIIPSDDEDFLMPLADIIRKNKVSSNIDSHNKSLETTSNEVVHVAKEPKKANFPALNTSELDINNILLGTTGKRLVRTVSRRTLLKLKHHFKLLDLQVKVVSLEPYIIDNINKVCSGKENWKSNENLRKAGLPEYDIVRLGVRSLHRVKCKSSRYTFRQFLKKRERYDIDEVDYHHKKMREERRKKKLQEKKKQEITSIRRALLKINQRIISQSRLWSSF